MKILEMGESGMGLSGPLGLIDSLVADHLWSHLCTANSQNNNHLPIYKG